jgi:hypothetical protein
MVSTELQLGRLRFQLTTTFVHNLKYIIRIGKNYVVGICMIYFNVPCFKIMFGDYLEYHIYNNDYYYMLVSQKEQIQQQMESRALQQILKFITGEPTFEYR